MPDNLEMLFLRTLQDLRERAAAKDAYEVLGTSALLRKLLIDQNPLVDRVNRKHRIKLQYEVGQLGGPPAGLPRPTIFSVEDSLDPDTAPPFVKRTRVGRDQLLKQVLLITREHEYTLREIILFVANVMGGVHAGSPKDERERVLDTLNKMFEVGGYAMPLRQLKAIARVVLKGLEPLRLAIEAQGA